MQGGEVHTGFSGGGNPRERDHFEDLSVCGAMILKWIFRKCDGNAWFGLMTHEDRLPALVGAVMNLWML